MDAILTATNIDHELPAEAYRWRAIYDPEGDDVLDEHEANGSPHTFAEIDQDRLLAFVLIPQWPGLTAHALHLAPGQRLIWFRRTRMDASGANANVPRRAHVVGWQQTVGDQNVKSMTAFFDNGSSLACSDETLIQL